MTGAIAKWTTALEIFDRIKHTFRAHAQLEKDLSSIPLEERVLMFRGTDSEIVERLSVYVRVQGECCMARASPV